MKVKSVCSKYANLSKFLSSSLQFNLAFKMRDHDSLMAMVKKKVSIFQNSDEEQYSKLLTPYAFEFLHKWLELMKKVKMTDSGVLSSEGVLLVIEDNCQCKFWCTMWLPCRHVFAVRENLDKPLFCSTLVSERWKLAYLCDVW